MTSICIGCGCTDEHACAGGCSWARVEPLQHVGVCSNCVRCVADWDAGLRTVRPAVHQKRIARCRSCKAPIIWFRTISGRNIPIDAKSVNPNDTQHDAKRHIAHFATCPDRDQHRRAR